MTNNKLNIIEYWIIYRNTHFARMFVFRLIFLYLSIYDVSEGRTIQAMIGRNVSFSFTFTNITTGDINILHKKLLFISVWPAEKFHFVHKEPEKVRVSVDMSRGETIIVIISLLNITKENAGIYTVAQQWDSEKFNDSILLQTIEGRTVQAVIGRNVSFSFTFSNITTDDIIILHDTSLFLSVWPAENVCVPHEEPENVRASVDKSWGETIIVKVNLLNITKKNAGIYTVAQQWNSDEFKDGALLQTIDDTMIPRIAIARQIVSDSSLMLQCFTSSSYTGKLIWKLNASLIENYDRYWHNNNYFSIRNLTADEQYNSYTCSEQESGLESDSYRLKANGPSVVIFAPNKTVVMEHDSLNVSCISDCDPVCTCQWTKLDRSSGFETGVSAENTFYINNITRQDAGKYTCKVQNVISGTAYTNILALDVVYGPDEILFNASDTTIEMGEFHCITISCSADCFPPCQIHWSQSNKHIPGADLWLNNLQNGGNFTCHARNARNVKNSISKTISIILKSGSGYYTTKAKDAMDDTEATGTSYYTTTANNKTDDTGATGKSQDFTIISYKQENDNIVFQTRITILSNEVETTLSSRFPGDNRSAPSDGMPTLAVNKALTATNNESKLSINRLLMYLVIGMGVLLVTGLCICILRMFVKCPRLNRVPDNNQFQDSGEENPLQANLSEEYWTIVCNADGDLGTELETNISQINEPTSITNITVTEVTQLEAPPQFQRMEVGMEFDGYIHAIHSDPVNASFMPTRDTTEV